MSPALPTPASFPHAPVQTWSWCSSASELQVWTSSPVTAGYRKPASARTLTCLCCHRAQVAPQSAQVPLSLPRCTPCLITEEEAPPWLSPPFVPMPRAEHRETLLSAWGSRCHRNPESGSEPGPSHSCTPGHADLRSRATPDPSELIFIYNVSHHRRAQVRKHGNLLLGTPSRREHASRDKIFQPLTTGGDEQTGTKSRGLSPMWANPFEHLHSPAVK